MKLFYYKLSSRKGMRALSVSLLWLSSAWNRHSNSKDLEHSYATDYFLCVIVYVRLENLTETVDAYSRP